jgi:dTDP-4-dehydrorhamnose reductase
MTTNDNILIINSNSFIGKSIVNRLERNNYNNIIINNELDLTNEKAIDFFIKRQHPDIIFICFNNLFLQDRFIKICNNYDIKMIIRFSMKK